MTYLFDTNAAIAVIKGHPPAVRERARHEQRTGAAVAISSIVAFELWYGVAYGAYRAENDERLRIFLAGGVEVLPFNEDDARIAGDIRAELRRAGTPIGPYDVLIAAQAIRTGSTLVTANTREFARISALVLEDWSRG